MIARQCFPEGFLARTAERAVAIAFALAAGLTTPAAQTERPGGSETARIRQQLIGSYKLVWYVGYDQNGAETKLPYRVGQISYDAAGRMSAQLMRDPSVPPPVPPAGGTGRGGGNPGGYVAYFGRYEIDAEKRTVTPNVEGSIGAGMVGAAMVRHFDFSPDGESLFLSVKNGDRVTGRLRWDRHR
jgi:catechol 1,2-dioxygenase